MQTMQPDLLVYFWVPLCFKNHASLKKEADKCLKFYNLCTVLCKEILREGVSRLAVNVTLKVV